MVRKKAALTLLRLYRKHPDVIPAGEWALRIVSIMDDMDLVGTLLSEKSLVLMVYSRVLSTVSPVSSWPWRKITLMSTLFATKRPSIDCTGYVQHFKP